MKSCKDTAQALGEAAPRVRGGDGREPVRVGQSGYGSEQVADEQTLEIAGRRVAVTSPDKVFFSERGETKLDLVRYYLCGRRAVPGRLRRSPGPDAALPRRRRGEVVLPEARP